MIHSKKTLAKKATVLLGPVFLILFAMYLFLPSIRKYVIRQNLGMVSYDRENLVVYAPEEEQTREIWKTFRDYEKAFRERFRGRLNFSNNRRLRIHLFRNRSEMSEYFETKYHTSLPHNAGFYDQSDQAIALTMTPDREDLKNAIRHEAVHYFLQSGTRNKSPRWSPWLNEGLASVFEHYQEIERPDGSVEWGIPRETVIDEMISPFRDSGFRSMELIPLKEFINVKEKKFRSANNAIYYRQSTLLVFFLLSKYPDAFWAYFEHEKKTGPTNPGVLVRMLGKDLASLEEELKSWVREPQLQ